MSKIIHDYYDFFSFNWDWKPYLEGVTFKYSKKIHYFQRKTLLGFSDYEDLGEGKLSLSEIKTDIQIKEDKIAAFCRKYDLDFKPETVYEYSEVRPDFFSNEHAGSGAGRQVWKERKADIFMPAELSTRLLHTICRKGFEDILDKIDIASSYKKKGLTEKGKELAGAARAMMLEDIRLFGKERNGKDEYKIKIIVNAGDFRYTEPGGDIAGILFRNEGFDGLKTREERELFAAAILTDLREDIRKSDDVYDVYIRTESGNSNDGFEADMLVMYK